ncbi:hypothetical protein PC129_g16137 [Phytophthora cactorum]|uniref:Uncharacterized protein n=1 Tax=Phytophthora cactorum TaxID=29920 RepID=A0A8T1HLU8_9STRA|nr:hypothetical protein PC129_g16137 [Phytophthora cactorum]
MMLYRVYLCRPAFHQLLHRTLWTLFGAPTSTFSRTLRRAEEALSKALNGFFPLMKVAPRVLGPTAVQRGLAECDV